jgi:hypothetical protein
LPRHQGRSLEVQWRYGLETSRTLEEAVAGDEGQAEADGSSRGPAVAVVELVPEGVTGPSAVGPQLRAHEHHLVVGLENGQPCDATFEPTLAELSPTSADGPEAQLHHRLESEQHRRRPDEVSVMLGKRVGLGRSSKPTSSGCPPERAVTGGETSFTRALSVCLVLRAVAVLG